MSTNDPRYREIRRADDGGKAMLRAALNPDDVVAAFSELLLSNPGIVGPIVLAMRDLIPRFQSEGAAPSLTINSQIGFIYFGRFDMAQAQQQRAAP